MASIAIIMSNDNHQNTINESENENSHRTISQSRTTTLSDQPPPAYSPFDDNRITSVAATSTLTRPIPLTMNRLQQQQQTNSQINHNNNRNLRLSMPTTRQQHQHEHYHHTNNRSLLLHNQSNRSTSPTLSTMASTASVSCNDKSPFLIMKILLFSLMTIDFAMNTIGLAVIIVIVKNHYNNFIVEKSFLIRSEYIAANQNQHNHFNSINPSADQIIPSIRISNSDILPTGDILSATTRQHYEQLHPQKQQTERPHSQQQQQQSEWSLLLPLLPSFIFAEILTLIGMFGVFCDLFSFTMTYAILKLVTSLCYPSMASVAAVAAMASATSSSSSSSPILPTISNSFQFNHAHQPPFSSMIAINMSTPTTTTIAPSLIQGLLPFSIDENKSENDDSIDSSTTVKPPITTTSENIFYNMFSKTSRKMASSSKMNGYKNSEISIESTTALPLGEGKESDDEISDVRRLYDFDQLMTTPAPKYDKISKNTHNANRLKTYELISINNDNPNKDYGQIKKNDRFARLKAKEKLIRNRLLRLKTLENNGGEQQTLNSNQTISATKPASTPIIKKYKRINSILSPQPWIFDGQHQHNQQQQYRYSKGSFNHDDDNVLNSDDQLRLLLPTLESLSSKQQHSSSSSAANHMKYHHRVWDALLVTFQVIFAVAFAFNLLSYKRIYNAGSGNHSSGTDYHQNDQSYDDGYYLDPYFGNWDDIDIDNSNNDNSSMQQQRHRHNRHYYNLRQHYQLHHSHNRHSSSSSYVSNFFPHTPLATSIDAFYFAYFRLPPPPPSYFCIRNSSTTTTASTTRSAAAATGTMRISTSTASSLSPQSSSSTNDSQHHYYHHQQQQQSTISNQNSSSSSSTNNGSHNNDNDRRSRNNNNNRQNSRHSRRHHHQHHSRQQQMHNPLMHRNNNSDNHLHRNDAFNQQFSVHRTLCNVAPNIRRCLSSNWLSNRRNHSSNNNSRHGMMVIPSTTRHSHQQPQRHMRINNNSRIHSNSTTPPPQYEDIGNDQSINLLYIDRDTSSSATTVTAITTQSSMTVQTNRINEDDNSTSVNDSTNTNALTDVINDRIILQIMNHNENNNNCLNDINDNANNKNKNNPNRIASKLPTIIEVMAEDDDNEIINNHHDIINNDQNANKAKHNLDLQVDDDEQHVQQQTSSSYADNDIEITSINNDNINNEITEHSTNMDNNDDIIIEIKNFNDNYQNNDSNEHQQHNKMSINNDNELNEIDQSNIVDTQV